MITTDKTATKILETVLRIINDNMQRIGKSSDLDQITADTDLLAGGYIDSMALMQVMLQIENDFAISIPATRLASTRISSANRISELVVSLLHGGL